MTTPADFMIITAGVLTFKETPNYEPAADANTDNMYEVTVVATDSSYDADVSTTEAKTQWKSPSTSPTWTRTGR